MTDTTSGNPPFINRRLSIAEWLAYVADYDFGPIRPNTVVLHHTLVPTLDQWRGLASMRGMQSFYGKKGWTAAPHLYLGPDGIWLATPMKDIGIHANAGNATYIGGRLVGYSIGVEMVGNYDKLKPSGAVLDEMRAVLGALAYRMKQPIMSILHMHREYNTGKTCPGLAVTKGWVADEVEAWQRDHPTIVPQPPAVKGKTYTVKAVAIVRDDPNTNADIVQRLVSKPGKPATVQIVGSVTGQMVAGNATWYVTQDGKYIHSGALREGA